MLSELYKMLAEHHFESKEKAPLAQAILNPGTGYQNSLKHGSSEIWGFRISGEGEKGCCLKSTKNEGLLRLANYCQ